MNIYGSQLLCFNNYKSVKHFYITWRKTIRRIRRLDKRTHNVLINLINRCLPINNNNNNNNIYLKSNIHSIIRYKFSGLYNGIKHGIHIKTVQCI